MIDTIFRVCKYCGANYKLNFAHGSGHHHCNKYECSLNFKREQDERNRQMTRVNMRELRAMREAV